jgi:hypothetical protein
VILITLSFLLWRDTIPDFGWPRFKVFAPGLASSVDFCLSGNKNQMKQHFADGRKAVVA